MALRADPLTAARRQRAQLGPLGRLAVAEVPKPVDVRYSPVTRRGFDSKLRFHISMSLYGCVAGPFRAPTICSARAGRNFTTGSFTRMLKTMFGEEERAWLQLS
jgi:hypothetical protein